jgi:tRNA 2-thiouridine synthesizing protein A
MHELKIDLCLDAVGLYCPMPIVKTSKAIKQIQVGQVLEVVADDEDIKEDMPNWCKATGHEFLGLKEADGEYHVYVKRRV